MTSHELDKSESGRDDDGNGGEEDDGAGRYKFNPTSQHVPNSHLPEADDVVLSTGFVAQFAKLRGWGGREGQVDSFSEYSSLS